MASDSVEELVKADSWAGEHEHVNGHGSMDVFIPRWVLWSLAGVGVGVVALVFWNSYINDQKQRQIADAVKRQRDRLVEETRPGNTITYVDPGHPLHGTKMDADEFLQLILQQNSEAEESTEVASDENAPDTVL